MTSEVKLPELPEAVAYCEPNNPHNDDAFAWPGAARKDYHTTHLFTAAQMEAYARAAVEASQPNMPIDGLMNEYGMGAWTPYEASIAAKRYVSTMPDSQVRCLLHILAKAQPTPKSEAVKGGEWRERYHDRCRVISDWHQRAVALGYDGVNELLALALPCIVNNAGDERPDKDNPND